MTTSLEIFLGFLLNLKALSGFLVIIGSIVIGILLLIGLVNKMESFLTEAKEYNTFNPEKTSKQFLSEIDTIKIKGYIAGEQKYSNEANNFANESNFEQTKKSVL